MSTEQVKQELANMREAYKKRYKELTQGLSSEEMAEITEGAKNVDGLMRFTANGRVYVVRETLTIARFMEFEKLQPQVAWGIDFRNMFQNLSSVYGCLNEGKNADAAVMVHNLLHGIKNNVEERENPIFLLCTLYICREDEDVKTWDISIARAKIEDWKAEGIDFNSFFTLAFKLVDGFSEAYKTASADISTKISQVVAGKE